MSKLSKEKILKIYNSLLIGGTSAAVIGLGTLVASMGIALDINSDAKQLAKDKEVVIAEASLSEEWLNHLASRATVLKDARNSNAISENEYNEKLKELKEDDYIINNRNCLNDKYCAELASINERENDILQSNDQILAVAGVSATVSVIGTVTACCSGSARDKMKKESSNNCSIDEYENV